MTVVQLDGETPGEVDVDLAELWDVTYRVVGDFDPPDHHRGGPEVFEAPEGGDLAELNGEVELLAGDDERPAPTWAQVAALFDSSENGSTTRGYDAAAARIDHDHDFVTVRDSDAVYYFEPDLGFYVRKGTTFIDQLLEREIPQHVNQSRARNIRYKVRSRNFIEAEDFVAPQNKVNVRNGVIDLERWAEDPDPDHCLLDHSPDYYFTARLNVRYNPEADDGGFFEGALETAIPDPNERRKWLEWVGHCLEFWTTDMEYAMVMVGFSGAGKTSLQEAVKAMFGGPPTVTALAPHQVADNQFDSGMLWEAALNTVNDINGGKIQDTGTLKRTISGESTKLEKKHEDAMFGEPRAKHLWTANWMPRLVGQDDAVYRRFVLVEFLNQIPESEIDPGYRDRMRDDESVHEVLLNLALEGRQRFRDREPAEFTNDRTRVDTRRLWDKWRDSNKLFLYEQFELTGDEADSVEKQTYWRAYSTFAGTLGLERKSNRAVSESLQWVPEIGGTSGDSDSYTGLVMKDRDAVESLTGEKSDEGEPGDATIESDHQRVEDFITGRYAPEKVVNPGEVADELGVDPEAAERAFENAADRSLFIKRDDGTFEAV